MQQALAASRKAEPAYDGVAELWWDSMEDFAGGNATPEGRAAALELLEDERKFIDHARSPLWVSEEHEIVGENACRRRKIGRIEITDDGFNRVGPISVWHPVKLGPLIRCFSLGSNIGLGWAGKEEE